MKFTVNKDVFYKNLQKINRIVSSNAITPVLSGVHIRARNNELIITGTDTDVSVIKKIPNDLENGLMIEEEGSIVLPAKEFTKIVRSLPNSLINVTLSSEDKATIAAGKSKFNLNGEKGTQYPKIKVPKDYKFVIESEGLKALFDKTRYAVSKNETRPILTGVNLFFAHGQIGSVSTDAHRLSRVIIGDVKGTPFDEDITIPFKTVKELPSLLDDTKKVHVTSTDSQIVFNADKTTIVSRLLTGQYPNIDRLIPDNHQTEIIINRKEFIDSLERSAVLAKKESSVNFKISGKNKGIFETIQLSHVNGELGESKEELIVDEIFGEELDISFNPRYVIEALKSIDSDQASIQFNGPMKPFIIRPKGNEKILNLVLPVRTY